MDLSNAVFDNIFDQRAEMLEVRKHAELAAEEARQEAERQEALLQAELAEAERLKQPHLRVRSMLAKRLADYEHKQVSLDEQEFAYSEKFALKGEAGDNYGCVLVLSGSARQDSPDFGLARVTIIVDETNTDNATEHDLGVINTDITDDEIISDASFITPNLALGESKEMIEFIRTAIDEAYELETAA